MPSRTNGRPDDPTAEQFRSSTPARVATGRVGVRPPTSAWLQFRADHAMARDAVGSEFSDDFLKFVHDAQFPLVQSLAVDKHDFVQFPPKGKRIDEGCIRQLQTECPLNREVQITISDGLSARAIENNIHDFLPMLLDGLELERITFGLPVVVRYGRVAVGDQITHSLGAKLSIILIGERPGLSASDSMSAYLTLDAGPNTISSDRTVVSNIHSRGTIAVEAAAHVVQLAKRILKVQASGVKLQQMTK